MNDGHGCKYVVIKIESQRDVVVEKIGHEQTWPQKIS